MVKTESNFWKFPQDERFEDRNRGFVTPGPGMYETQHAQMMGGGKKSSMGEGMDRKQLVESDLPGPGAYWQDKEIPKSKSVPGFKFTGRPKEKVEYMNGEPVGPQKYNPQNPCYTSYGWGFGPKNGMKDGKGKANRFVTPGPGHNPIRSQFDPPQTPFENSSMGMKLKSKMPNGADMPGPGEYELGVPKNLHGHCHVFGTGMRSDLGVGKAYLAPGPGQYNVRDDIKKGGKKMSFGSERKKTKIKKGYNPGPGSYNLPGTVGNIPKYMLIANKQAAKKIKRSKSVVSYK